TQWAGLAVAPAVQQDSPGRRAGGAERAAAYEQAATEILEWLQLPYGSEPVQLTDAHALVERDRRVGSRGRIRPRQATLCRVATEWITDVLGRGVHQDGLDHELVRERRALPRVPFDQERRHGRDVRGGEA